MDSVLTYVAQALMLSLRQFIFLFAISLLLSYLMQMVNIRLLRNSNKLLGYNLYNWLFGWISIPVHELGHAFFAVLFGHKVTKLVLFDPNRSNGYGGIVQHTWSRNNLYHKVGNLFIGLGPIILGSIVIWGLSWLLLSISFSSMNIYNADSGLIGQLGSIPHVLLQGVSNALYMFKVVFGSLNWKNLLFLYFSFAIGTNICLSDLDIGHLRPALLTIISILLVFNLATAWMGDFSLNLLGYLEEGLSVFYGILVYVLILNIVYLVVTQLLIMFTGKH